MLVTAALLAALAASVTARHGPARLDERQNAPATPKNDRGYTLKHQAECIVPSKKNFRRGTTLVAANCTKNPFVGWNLDGSGINAAHHLRVANTTLCLSAGRDSSEWRNGLDVTLEECTFGTSNETWTNLQVWRKDSDSVDGGPAAYRLMDQQTLSPYKHYPSGWCLDVRDGWTPNSKNTWGLQLWQCASTSETDPNPNQLFTDNWEAGINA